MKWVLKFMAQLAAVPLQGLALCVLWHWFVVSTFHVSDLTIPQALGISLLAASIIHQATYDEEDDNRALTIAYARPVCLILMGWMLTWFM